MNIKVGDLVRRNRKSQRKRFGLVMATQAIEEDNKWVMVKWHNGGGDWLRPQRVEVISESR